MRGRQKLIEYEWMSYRTQVVERELTERFIEKLTKHLEKGEIQGFVPVKSRRREQLPLPLKRD